jgi:hypothetical protein
MRSRRHKLTAWLLGGWLFGAWPAAAQPPEGPVDLPAGELRRLFEAYAIVQAQEMLQLSDAQYAQFVPRLKALQETRWRLQRERQQIVDSLQRLVASGSAADETALRDRLKALADHDLRAATELRKAYEAIDQVLDLRQQARFRIFEARMERRRLELLLRARQPFRPGGARRPPSPDR